MDRTTFRPFTLWLLLAVVAGQKRRFSVVRQMIFAEWEQGAQAQISHQYLEKKCERFPKKQPKKAKEYKRCFDNHDFHVSPVMPSFSTNKL